VEAFQGAIGLTVGDVARGAQRVGENVPAAYAATRRGDIPGLAGALTQTGLGTAEAAFAPLNFTGHLAGQIVRQEGAPAPVAQGVDVGTTFLTTGGPEAVAGLVRGGRTLIQNAPEAAAALARVGTLLWDNARALSPEAALGIARGTGRTALDPAALDEAVRLYQVEERSIADTASALGLPQRAVARAIDQAGVRRTPSEAGAIAIERINPDALPARVIPYTKPDGSPEYAHSTYEAALMAQLDNDPTIAYWTKRLGPEGRVRYGPNGERTYVPDFLTVGTDGRMEVVEVKPAYRVLNDPDVMAKAQAARDYFGELGMGYRLFTEEQIGRDFLRTFDPAQVSGIAAERVNEIRRHLRRVPAKEDQAAARITAAFNAETRASRVVPAAKYGVTPEGTAATSGRLDTSVPSLLRGAAGAPDVTGTDVLLGRAGAVAGGIQGYQSSPEGASPQERIARTAEGALIGGVGTMGAARSLRSLGTLARGSDLVGIIADVTKAPVTDAAGTLLSRAERLAQGGVDQRVPLPTLSPAGEAARQSLIEQNVRLGYSLKDAADLVDGYIAGLARGGQIPQQYVLPAAQRSTLARLNDALGTYGRLQLLLAPTTHLGNVAGNVAAMPWQLAEGLVAPLVEPVWRALGKAPEARYAGLTGVRMAGWWHSLAAGGANLLDVLRQGDAPLTQQLTGQAAATGRIGRALEVGFRPLSAVDALFKTIAEGGELYTQAGRQAAREGLRGDARWQRVGELVQQPPEAMVRQAERAGSYFTYNGELDRVGKLLNDVARLPGMQFVVPFIRVPYNALKFDLERSPLGALSVGKAALDPAATSGELADRTARTLIGGVIAGALFKYALDGNVAPPTWPDNPQERDAWTAEGKTPGAVRIGGSWWDLRRVPGLGANLALAGAAADTARRMQQPDASFTQEAGRLSLSLAQALAQKPLLDNLAGLMGAINDPANGGAFLERLGAGVASQLLPGSSALRTVEKVTDPLQRAPQGLVQRVEAGIPGPAGTVPVRRDAFGNALPRDQTGLEAAVNPFPRSMARPGMRRYQGSQSAEQDTQIAAAIARVQQAYKAGRRPDPRDQRVYDRFIGRENVPYRLARQQELQRQRAQRAQPTPPPLDVRTLLANLPRYVYGGK
jgi:hypothetical protein